VSMVYTIHEYSDPLKVTSSDIYKK